MEINEIVKETLLFLRSGKVILYPTDTIWGLGCDPYSREAGYPQELYPAGLLLPDATALCGRIARDSCLFRQARAAYLSDLYSGI